VDLLVRIAHPVLSTLVAALLFGIAAIAQLSPAQGAQAGNEEGKARFLASLPHGFQIPPESDEVSTRLLAYYGAVLVARGGATPPPVIMFADEDAVTNWQASLMTATTTINKTVVELQSVALGAFVAAKSEAQAANFDITPQGANPAKRDYLETVKLWKSRVDPGLAHWVAAGRISTSEARRIRNLSPSEQVPEIFLLENRGLFFAADFSRTILSSVAPPGASQHISMLAIDINEHENVAVRAILAEHGWYQTALLDTPHFTYLGVSEQDLPALGLHKVNLAGRDYWIPDLGVSMDKLLGRQMHSAASAGRNN
jgi:hypothetical protein